MVEKPPPPALATALESSARLTTPDVADEPARRRRPYVPPELKFLGTVKDLTRSGGSVKVTDSLGVPSKVSP